MSVITHAIAEIKRLRGAVAKAQWDFNLLANYGLEDESPDLCYRVMKDIAAESERKMRDALEHGIKSK